MAQTSKDTHKTAKDLRSHRRYHTRMTGRLIAADIDVLCTVLDVSAGGAKLKSEIIAAEGDDIALSIPHIGFMRGTVCRCDGDLISVVFDSTPEKMNALSDRIEKFFKTPASDITQNNKS